MFIRNSKIRSLIFLACVTAMTVHPSAWTAQAPASAMPLRFTNTDIYEFVDRMSEILGLTPMLVDPSVQGSVDLNVTIPRDEIFYLFNGILKSKNAALVRQDSLYQIVPLAFAMRNNFKIIDVQPAPKKGETYPAPGQPAPKREQAPENLKTLPVATHVIRMDFVPVEDIVEAVRLFVSDGLNIIIFKRQNMMIFTDYSDNAARVKELVQMLDNAYLSPDYVELVKIENNSAMDIADELKIIFGNDSAGGGAAVGAATGAAGGRVAGGNTGGRAAAVSSGATGVSFVPFERLNAIFVMAGTKLGLDTAKRWIEELDTYSGNKYQTFVYTVQDSTASNIAAMLLALYGDEGSAGSGFSSSGTGRNTQGTSMSRTGNSNSNRSLLDQALGSDGAGSTFGSAQQLGPRLNSSSPSISSVILRSGEFSNLRDEAHIVVNDIDNVLLIQSTLADYRSLLGAIEKMDKPPRQVRIDAQVIEYNLTNELTYGFQAFLEKFTEGNLTTVGVSEKGWLSAGTFVGIGSSRQIMLAVDALKAKTRVKTLQQPSIFAMDGIQASIISGAEVPYPGNTIITGNSLSTTSMEYRDTGISLIVVPRISASGSVILEIAQEVSTVSYQNVGDVAAPTFPKTGVQTTLSVKDGQTVAIAGLTSDTDRWIRAGIPLLSEIPLVGGLFGGTNRNNTRKELLVLITPHVIRTPDRFQEVTDELRDSLRNVRKQVDEYETNRVRDIEDARLDREKKELLNIRDIKQPK